MAAVKIGGAAGLESEVAARRPRSVAVGPSPVAMERPGRRLLAPLELASARSSGRQAEKSSAEEEAG